MIFNGDVFTILSKVVPKENILMKKKEEEKKKNRKNEKGALIDLRKKSFKNIDAQT